MNVDINLLREALTVAAMAAFGGVLWWAYAPARKQRFADQARSILEDGQP